MGAEGLPPIWTGKYSSWSEWEVARSSVAQNSSLTAESDSLYLRKPHLFRLGAYCSCCNSPQNMTFDWGLTSVGGFDLHIAWTEVLSCDACGMNSRMRAVWEFATSLIEVSSDARVYLPEAITPGFQKWKQRFPNAIGSEYVSHEAAPGSRHRIEDHEDVQHEDLTNLSFDNDSFKLIVSQDVFEHIPDFKAAFSECFRVLELGGTLLFSVPFFPDRQMTEIRVHVASDGSLNSDFPFEYHGNPMSSKGSLCFQHFGWSMLDDLRNVGFSRVAAHSYWSPTHGHLGAPFFVFSATK